MKTRDRIFNAVSILTLVSTMGLMLLVGFWSFWPYKIIEFEPITLNKTEYHAGEQLDMNITYVKYKPTSAILIRQFLNGMIFTLQDAHSNSPAGDGTNRSVDVTIPEELIPGEYFYRQTMIYKVNPVRDITVVFETPKFMVIEKNAVN
jgi:hypothetical protein